MHNLVNDSQSCILLSMMRNPLLYMPWSEVEGAVYERGGLHIVLLRGTKWISEESRRLSRNRSHNMEFG